MQTCNVNVSCIRSSIKWTWSRYDARSKSVSLSMFPDGRIPSVRYKRAGYAIDFSVCYNYDTRASLIPAEYVYRIMRKSKSFWISLIGCYINYLEKTFAILFDQWCWFMDYFHGFMDSACHLSFFGWLQETRD